LLPTELIEYGGAGANCVHWVVQLCIDVQVDAHFATPIVQKP
jgi:hypothetical protein